ncbi:hypothetical protein Q5424_01145 [Conexibacter sp. JD483]|uniref:hypothetical protein n=1 Tax=unclassified Conexibacter TaxID=2627773 RepID=UPI002715D948|nr:MULTISPECIES: hypothetical protein [unclassified Conexibacter]MDO8185834.1 hypothetical protein [Conexibacter sp. CPCC 205706]MDO8198578.1 hypothetical protein [Conexibacter sp. CPCC 205762]MDR9367664.1 hypothetical protein [Conexibacter sp. JD483]
MTDSITGELAIRYQDGEFRDAKTGAIIAYLDEDGILRSPDGAPAHGFELPFPTPAAAVSPTARVERNRELDAAWLQASIRDVQALAKRHDEFTTDEVWSVLSMPPREDRQIGGLMAACRARGFVEKTDATRPSVRPSCNRRPIRVWRSLLCDGTTPSQLF